MQRRSASKRVRIHIITVIYNRRISRIRSMPQFEAFISRYPEAGWIIADNSTDDVIVQENRETASLKNWLRYVECGGNIGLSRAYNRAIATIPQEEAYWIMLSDDDTYFSMEYLENAIRRIRHEQKLWKETPAGEKRWTREAEEDNPLKGGGQDDPRLDQGMRAAGGRVREPLRMLCGVVLTEGGWISPRSEHTKEFALSGLLRQPKPGIYRDLYPINSGLFLEGSAIREAGGFDERLFLDQVDFLMMDRLRSCGIRRIGVLPGKILQSFSGDMSQGWKKESSETPGQSADERFRIFRKDFQVYCELTGKPWYYRAWVLGRRTLMLGIQKKASFQ